MAVGLSKPQEGGESTQKVENNDKQMGLDKRS